jgi:hypothetical protein
MTSRAGDRRFPARRPAPAWRQRDRLGDAPSAQGAGDHQEHQQLDLAGKKAKGECTADERWALIRAAMEDQASGAMHVDPGTKDYKYTRAEVETLIAMTAALLCIMP